MEANNDNIQVSGNDWLGQSPCRMMFDLRNDGSAGKQLRPLGGPWPLFSCMRLLAGGQILAYVNVYKKVHAMFTICIATERRHDRYGECVSNS